MNENQDTQPEAEPTAGDANQAGHSAEDREAAGTATNTADSGDPTVSADLPEPTGAAAFTAEQGEQGEQQAEQGEPGAAAFAEPGAAAFAGPTDTGADATTLPTVTRTPWYRRRSSLIAGAAACALALSAGGFGAGFVVHGASDAVASAVAGGTVTAVAPDTVPQSPSIDMYPGAYGRQYDPYGSSGTSGTSGSTGTSGSATSQTLPVAASDSQEAGVVTIVSDLYYGEGRAAGTGIVLDSDGTILTNNHVIEGSTSVEVTVESTGETYSAEVVGTDATNDVAVLQLVGASGLQAATLDDSAALAVGDAVTSVGNAEGTGDLVAATGSVLDLDESITVGDESTGASESLADLIMVSAYVVSGDSGGPLVDADGEVVGIVTAASSGSAVVTGYAIPIDSALTVAEQIESGVESGTVEIGTPAFLGVSLANTTVGQTVGGALIGGVVSGGAAASAGITAGDTITSVDGVAVADASALSAAIAAHEPGDSVTLGWTDASGVAQQGTATLAAGPAA
jgi:S1-C subfamily serine protease